MRSAYLTKSISAATVRALNYTPSSTTLRQKVDEGNGTTVGALFTIGASYHSIFKQLDCSLSQGYCVHTSRMWTRMGNLRVRTCLWTIQS